VPRVLGNLAEAGGVRPEPVAGRARRRLDALAGNRPDAGGKTRPRVDSSRDAGDRRNPARGAACAQKIGRLRGRGDDEDPRQVPAGRWRKRGVGACCPGPRFVRSFLRTYADYLGLDSKLLVEEYRLPPRTSVRARTWRRSLRTSGPSAARRGSRGSARRACSRGWIIGLSVVAIIALLIVIGSVGGGGAVQSGQGRHPVDHEQENPNAGRPGRGPAPRPSPGSSSSRSTPSTRGLVDSSGKRLIDGPDARPQRPAAEPSRPSASPSSSATAPRSCGSTGRRSRSAGRQQPDRLRDHPDQPARALPGAPAPPAASERAPRRHRRHRDRGALGPRLGPQRAVAVRAPARGSVWTTRRRWWSATGARTCSRRCGSSRPQGDGRDRHQWRGSDRPPTISLQRWWGGFSGREMVLDEALEERIAEILKPLLSRWPQLDEEAIRALEPQAGP